MPMVLARAAQHLRWLLVKQDFCSQTYGFATEYLVGLVFQRCSLSTTESLKVWILKYFEMVIVLVWRSSSALIHGCLVSH